MKLIVFFALFAFAYGEYPAATPEIVEPSDSYGPPPEVPAATYSAPAAPADSYAAPAAPSDSYGAPTKAAIVVKATPIAPTAAPQPATAAAPEILTAPEPIITEAVAAAPAPSASFSFLSELTAPTFAQSSFALPQYQFLPPVQTYSLAPVRIALQAAPAPPVTIPPVNIPPIHNPLPLPPVSLPPLPAQPLPLETKVTAAPVAQITQIATLPRSYYTPQYFLSAPTPVTYAPSFSHVYQASALPTTFLTAPRITSQISTSTHTLPEFTSFKSQPVTVVKSAPAPRIPATSYGTPSFEAFSKKK